METDPSRTGEERGNQSRRTFLMNVTGAASTAVLAGRLGGSEALALHGGMPVRSTLLSAEVSGPQYYDDEERNTLHEVLQNKTPFRYQSFRAGPKPDKCSGFEQEFAAHQHTKYCVALTSGTMALHTAMAALDVGQETKSSSLRHRSSRRSRRSSPTGQVSSHLLAGRFAAAPKCVRERLRCTMLTLASNRSEVF
jgi:DegT/DnrJ/EryC1/StrS aminotransferase family